jgi:hypothetical protein
MELLPILQELIEKNGKRVVYEKLNLSCGTIDRWVELKNVPQIYEFDLLKLANIKIDYSRYSSKQKDQFFTPVETAKKCYELFSDEIKKYGDTVDDFDYIEPSAGDGSFVKVLPANTIAFDVDPKQEYIVEQDYLDWTPNVNNRNRVVVFGNPPFGMRGHTALKFINHSNKFAEYVCFILPQLFESDGKGAPRKRVEGFNLIFSTKLESLFYEPDKNELKINTIFQIWSKNHTNTEYDIKKYETDKMKIYSLSDGGTVASTRNKRMIDICDVYLPSTCFGISNVKYYLNFKELPCERGFGLVFSEDCKNEMMEKVMRTKWFEIAFLSTNSAYNLRSSQIYSVLL